MEFIPGGRHLPPHVSVTQSMIIRLIQSLLTVRDGDEGKAGRKQQHGRHTQG